MSRLTLVSHVLCPYVQRAAIVLAEKRVPFARRWVDLANKPAWFHAVSPLGKTPVLLVDDEPVFESAVICEYLDETHPAALHPRDPLQRARHRSWIAFGSAVLDTIAAFYAAPDEDTLERKRAALRSQFEQLEATLAADGPWFAGTQFALVDAAFAPVFRYVDAFEQLGEPTLFAGLPRVQRWRTALAARASVRTAAAPGYEEQLRAFLHSRGSALSRRIAGRTVDRDTQAAAFTLSRQACSSGSV
jgi:glutathione S-transferase